MKTNALSLILISLITCFASLRPAEAVDPPPDGGYPGGNTAEGQTALLSLTTGGYNTAVGFLSLRSNTTNSFNTAVGAGALLANTADENTATGAGALLSNTSGGPNTANGAFALFSNTTGNNNNAFGFEALFSNTTGTYNNAFGNGALVSNTGGLGNNAFGDGALHSNTGGNNTAVGDSAGYYLTTGSGNVCIGQDVFGDPGESDTTRIRNIYASVATARAVYVDEYDKIGTLSSSRRFKEEIKPMDKASETLLALKPVTFRYKKEIDPGQALSYGLIAEEVAQINPELITRDKEGKPQTVRYDAVNAMLLNEFLKQHKKTEKLEATVASHIATVKEQATQIQKVSALEVHKPAPQTVLNDQ